MRLLAVLLLCFCASAYAVDVSGPQPRDLNGDGITDAWYDPAANITYADYRFGRDHLNWFDANSFVDSFSLGGITGWRLPRILTYTGTPCAVTYGVDNCSGLIDATGEPRSVDPSVISAWWGMTDGMPWITYYGLYYVPPSYYDEWSVQGFADPVHDGDVAAVPEPSTYALLALGLAVLLTARWARAYRSEDA